MRECQNKELGIVGGRKGRTAVSTRQSSAVRWRMALVSNFMIVFL